MATAAVARAGGLRKTGEIIIGNIDENGYLAASMEEIRQAADAPMESVDSALFLSYRVSTPPG